MTQVIDTAPKAFSVRDLVVEFDGRSSVLRDLTFEAARAEHVAIVGSSGAGKTTLLRCLAGTETRARGDVTCAGVVATVHQDLRLVPQTSALANVLHGALGRTGFWASMGGFPQAERARAMELLQRVGLADRASQRVRSLSGGEQQRVAIARALMQQPTILLADEPVAALDDENAERVLALLTKLCREEGVTLVTVLHQRALATRFADRVLELREGRLEPYRGDAMEPAEPCARCGEAPHVGAPDAIELLVERTTAPEPLRVPEGPTHDIEARFLGGKPLRFGLIAALALGLYGWSLVGLDLEARQLSNAPRNLLAFIASFVPRDLEALTSLPWPDMLRGLRETLQMSLLATTAGILGSLPLAVLAARNLSPSWASRATRQLLNAVRTLPSIVWAMLFVAAVGLGPFAGILALFCYTLGYLTKFFYEAFEGTSRPTQDALRDLGASGAKRFLHAVWPAALPAFLSASLFMLEYNVRSASVLGVVDAGGIGVQLQELLIYRNFPGAALCLALVLGVVIILDALSSRVRDWAVRR